MKKEFSILQGLYAHPTFGMVWKNEFAVDIDYFTCARGYSMEDRAAIEALDIDGEYVIREDYIIDRIA